jgi:putative two-component system response regulator
MVKTKDNIFKDFSGREQLKKYAKDLAKVYKSEKEKRRELKASNKQLIKYAEDLNKNVAVLKKTYKKLNDSYLSTIHRLVMAAEYKDEDTGDHIVRMGRYCMLIAERSGISSKVVQNMLYSVSMHDVGKVGIPDSILTKTGELTDEEFEKMKTHTTIGANILAGSDSEILQTAEKIAVSHHEKWNGKGYPHHLSGKDIPVSGRIVAIADVFDALTSRRPYKKPYPVEVACDIIKKEKGESFEPRLVDIFFDNIDEILKIKKEVGPAEDIVIDEFFWSERDIKEDIKKKIKPAKK